MEIGARLPPREPRRSERGTHHVFGPLPRLHRLLMLAAALVVGVASGAWIAHFVALPVAASAGAVIGAVAGLALGYLLVHDFHAHAPPMRARRH